MPVSHLVAERCCCHAHGNPHRHPRDRRSEEPSPLESIGPAARRGTLVAMALRDELLKSIWHAFTALDVDKSGKVSKSQLKVLSYNLCTLMKIPHDPVALEDHFKDDDEGPVSNQGYMPYLSTFILDKVSPTPT
ncbi:hypothetical protein NHX12_003075 [Muraenolepis orangiensis]|uniref:EF-hand domain-containing protein n=1 Tax=Muraenolepis orangiensis TaxID=630683 RepID=A0A9Q0DZN5_9TELE|nr:hypothetical protein NHX12_003075 [Muraenolepis orangiensis]